MSAERMRLAGGALHGKVLWVEQDRTTVDVHIGGQMPGATKTLHYRRSGAMFCFMGESQTAPAQRETALTALGSELLAFPTRVDQKN